MAKRSTRKQKQTDGQRELIRQIEAYGGEGYVVVVKVGPHESDAMVMPDERFPKVFRANYEAVDYARHGYPKGLGPTAKLRVWRITKQGDRFVRDVVWRSEAAERDSSPRRNRARRPQRDPDEVDRLYRSLSRASKDYLESFVSDRSYKDVLAASRGVPEKDKRAVRVLLDGVTPAFKYRDEYEGFDD